MKKLAALALAVLASGGCMMPDDPSSSDYPAHSVVGTVTADAVVLDITGHGTFQPMLDTDQNHTTGAYPQPQVNGYGGYEYLVRMSEARGDSVPVRSTDWQDPDPDPRAQGWGVVTGWATRQEIAPLHHRLTIPKSAIGNDDGALFYFVFFEDNGSYLDGNTGTASISSRATAVLFVPVASR
ncbi:MAG: hypothetical protein HYR73_01080 [Candidatus Eisenbacteria bacterium]|nr:hypothetical protein [Candidatus Eisenbacteria bacterium]